MSKETYETVMVGLKFETTMRNLQGFLDIRQELVTKRPRITTIGSSIPRSVQISAHVVVNPDSTYPVVIEPYKIDISQYGEKVRREAEFTLKNRSDVKLKVEIIDFPSAIFELDLDDEIAANGEIVGKLKLKSGYIEKSFEKSMTFAVIPADSDKPIRFSIPLKRAYRKITRKTDSLATVAGKGSK
ncbi:MAG: hypothetical protein IIB00_11090 [candidate division Zixibacteria bacterium]|nr:hypothetical protein [candidate division Zixibacteria bacterium]